MHLLDLQHFIFITKMSTFYISEHFKIVLGNPLSNSLIYRHDIQSLLCVCLEGAELQKEAQLRVTLGCQVKQAEAHL